MPQYAAYSIKNRMNWLMTELLKLRDLSLHRRREFPAMNISFFKENNIRWCVKSDEQTHVHICALIFFWGVP